MRFRIIALMCFVFALSTSLAAQSRVITNADLEKYRLERLKADREYRENYEKLGMPSPEELARRRDQSRIEADQLSAKLRDAELERERLDIQRGYYSSQPTTYFSFAQPAFGYGGFAPAYLLSYGRRQRYSAGPYQYQQPGYFAGGQFWPTGSRTPPQPLISRPRNPRR